jgi:hypothetical protein
MGQNNIVKSPDALIKVTTKSKFIPVDGNEATANVAYQMSNVSFIYPVSFSFACSPFVPSDPCLSIFLFPDHALYQYGRVLR